MGCSVVDLCQSRLVSKDFSIHDSVGILLPMVSIDLIWLPEDRSNKSVHFQEF